MKMRLICSRKNVKKKYILAALNICNNSENLYQSFYEVSVLKSRDPPLLAFNFKTELQTTLNYLDFCMCAAQGCQHFGFRTSHRRQKRYCSVL
jgi:hypothetical protein